MYEFDWSSIPGALPYMAQGMKISLEITVTAVLVGIVWGTVLAMMRLSSITPLSWFAAAYVNFFRAIPLVMVLLWFFLIIPHLLETLFGFPRGSDMRLGSAIAGFSLFEAAYYSEIIRAGIQSVPKGQMAASNALGMSYGQSMRLVVLPQAFRNMVPLLLTQGIILFQDTSLVYLWRGLQGRRPRRTSCRNAAFRRRRLFCHLLCFLAAGALLPEETQNGLKSEEYVPRRTPNDFNEQGQQTLRRLSGPDRLHNPRE